MEGIDVASTIMVDTGGEEGEEWGTGKLLLTGNYTNWYKFLPVGEGVTREEGAAMCREVGGSLASPSTRQEWSLLKEHMGQVEILVLP